MKFYKLAFIGIFSIFCTNIYCQTFSKQQQLPQGHWVYDFLEALFAEQKAVNPALQAPLSIAELNLYLSSIDYDSLSENAKNLYVEIYSFFNSFPFMFRKGKVGAGAQFSLHPNFIAKTNENVDFTFAPYTALSSYSYDDEQTNSSIVFPLFMDFGDIIAIESVPYFGKTLYHLVEHGNIKTNILTPNKNSFTDVKYAYGSAGYTFDTWGFTVSAGKGGITEGRTQTGSIIYNSTFQTDGYVELEAYSSFLKYTMDVIQIDQNQRWFYFHRLNFSPFKWIRMGISEGTLVNGSFEARYLNPLVFMHGFFGWTTYIQNRSKDEQEIYVESDYCAYFAATVDFVPTKNLRFYLLFAQDEIQSFAELNASPAAMTVPDGLGFQLGAEYTLLRPNGAFWTYTAEGIYTTPFLYIKQLPSCSLYKNIGTNLNAWIGTPFGPDSIGFETKASYKSRRFSFDAEYLFVAHGTNSFNLFNNQVIIKDDDGNEHIYYSYYPSVAYNIYQKYKLKGMTYEEAVSLARSYLLTGTVQFSNTISASAKYTFNDHWSINGKAAYTFVFNNKNIQDNFAQSLELTLAFTFNLFGKTKFW